MFADVHGGQLSRTDYFQSRDCEEGRAWLRVQDHVWHVLLPHPPHIVPTRAVARPVCDDDEPEGWRWRLELPHRIVPLTVAQILGPRPVLPLPHTRSARTLHLYASELERHGGQSFFGSLRPGIQVFASCPLFLVRG